MKKVIFQVVSHFEMGGAERIAFNISKSRNEDFEYHIVEVVRGNSAYTKEMLKELEGCGITYHRATITNTKKAILAFPWRMKKLYDKYHPAVIHTHTETPDLAIYLFAKLFPWCKFKFVRTLHNTVLWSSWGWIGRIVEKYVQEKKANVSIGIGVTQSYVDLYGGGENVRLVYNGFTPFHAKVYEGIVAGKVNVLFAGRFVPQKGLETLVEIIKKANPDTCFFHVAGTGPMEDFVKTNLAQRENVRITPPIANLSSYVSSFDYVLITSVHEGLSSLSIEASMNGTPSIINDIDGLNETLPKDWPLKVNDNDIQQYAEIFEHLQEMDHSQLIAKARAFARQRFSMEKMQEGYEKIYSE